MLLCLRPQYGLLCEKLRSLRTFFARSLLQTLFEQSLNEVRMSCALHRLLQNSPSAAVLREGTYCYFLILFFVPVLAILVSLSLSV